MYGARPVYTHHARNFVFLPSSRIGQQPGPVQPGQPGPMQPAPLGQSAPPIRADVPPAPEVESPRVHVAWGPLIAAGIIGGAAFALGAGLINKFVFQK